MARPRKYDTVDKLENAIEEYFNSITIDKVRMQTVIELDENGEEVERMIPLLNNNGDEIVSVVYIENPSILALSRYLKIDRHTLQYMSDNPIRDENDDILHEFSTTIKKAKARIEEYVEDQLYREKNVTGIIFNLKNNFGWVDKQEVESKNVNLNTEMSVAEAEEILRKNGMEV